MMYTPTKSSSMLYVPSVNIYTDGACSNNGTPGAIAGIGIYVEERPNDTISECIPEHYPQTNQVAELLAIHRAIQEYSTSQEITIYTDSAYSINCINVWYNTWSNNNWKKADGSSPKNIEIIKELMRDITALRAIGKQVSTIKVPAHTTNIGNNKANSLAQDAVKRGKKDYTARAMDILQYVEDIHSTNNSPTLQHIDQFEQRSSTPLDRAIDDITTTLSGFSSSVTSPAPLDTSRFSIESSTSIHNTGSSVVTKLETISIKLNELAAELSDISKDM